LVEAEDRDKALAAIAIDWPESVNDVVTFVEEKSKDWMPTSDRFPLSKWMIERIQG
jgi:hypothetical protein